MLIFEGNLEQRLFFSLVPAKTLRTMLSELAFESLIQQSCVRFSIKKNLLGIPKDLVGMHFFKNAATTISNSSHSVQYK